MMVSDVISCLILCCCNHGVIVDSTCFKRLKHGTVQLVGVIWLRSHRQHECRLGVVLRLLLVVSGFSSLIIFAWLFKFEWVLWGVDSWVVLLFTDRAQAALIEGLCRWWAQISAVLVLLLVFEHLAARLSCTYTILCADCRGWEEFVLPDLLSAELLDRAYAHRLDSHSLLVVHIMRSNAITDY